MSRRRRAERREIIPDAKFGDLVLAKFMNSLMYDGKKSAAESIIYGAFDTIQQKTKQDPLQVFHDALTQRQRRRWKCARAASAALPIRCRSKCAPTVRARWRSAGSSRRARGRNEPTMTGRLSGEILDAANNRGNAVKKREDTHKMAEANRAFSHYRW